MVIDMIDEEFYLGKKQSEAQAGDAVPVDKPAETAPGALPESEPTVQPPQPEGDEEVKVKLDKKTKMILMAVFALLLCVAMTGGVMIARNTPETTETPFTYTTQPVTYVTNANTVPAVVPGEVLTEAGTTAAATAPAETLTQAAPSTTQGNAQTTAPVNTESLITRFEVNEDELSDWEQILYGFGFLYNPEQNMFYSQNDPWQRNMGYTSFYDDISVLGNMYYDTVRFVFTYDHTRWMYQIWKGRYGITSGCEMGIYYQDWRTENRQFYDIPTDEDPLPGMYFELYRYEDLMFTNGPATHWWLTGFRLLDSSESEALRMVCKFHMPNKGMCDAFEVAVQEQCAALDNLSYTREGNVISLDWAY